MFPISALHESLAQEVKGFGIKATLLEPGAYSPDFASPSSILFISQRAAQSIAVTNKALEIPGREDSILMSFPTTLEGQRRWRKDLLSLVRLPAICPC